MEIKEFMPKDWKREGKLLPKDDLSKPTEDTSNQYYCPLDGSKLRRMDSELYICEVCRLKEGRDPFFNKNFLDGYIAGYRKAQKQMQTKLTKLDKYIQFKNFDYPTRSVIDDPSY